MNNKTVFCTVANNEQADTLLNSLRASGFESKDVSVLFADKNKTEQFVHEKNTKAPEGAIAGVGTGGVIGGVLGWLVGIGSLAIPGVGPFIAAGPILAALSGSAIGATVGGLIGSLVGMGIPEIEAKNYEKKLKEGGVLVAAHTKTDEEVVKAKKAFKEAGATDISESDAEKIIETRGRPFMPESAEVSKNLSY